MKPPFPPNNLPNLPDLTQEVFEMLNSQITASFRKSLSTTDILQHQPVLADPRKIFCKEETHHNPSNQFKMFPPLFGSRQKALDRSRHSNNLHNKQSLVHGKQRDSNPKYPYQEPALDSSIRSGTVKGLNHYYHSHVPEFLPQSNTRNQKKINIQAEPYSTPDSMFISKSQSKKWGFVLCIIV